MIIELHMHRTQWLCAILFLSHIHQFISLHMCNKPAAIKHFYILSYNIILVSITDLLYWNPCYYHK